MVITMIIITALLAGAAVLTQMQVRSSRGAQLTRSGHAALYCAESGLTAAREVVTANHAQWNAALSMTTEPAWLAGIVHDIDGDTTADFMITLRDNDDETPNDRTRDNDLTVYVVSRCIKDPEQPTEVSELVRFNGAGNCYQSQLGGCGGNNNAN